MQFDVTEASIRRHRVAHLTQKLVQAQAAQEVLEADTLLNEVRTGKTRAARLYAAAERILERALDASDSRTALQAIRSAVEVLREAQALTELKGQISGELNQQPDQGGGLILLPVTVAPGTISPLNIQLDPEAVRQALAEREQNIVEAQVVHALPPAATGARAALPAPAPAPRPQP